MLQFLLSCIYLPAWALTGSWAQVYDLTWFSSLSSLLLLVLTPISKLLLIMHQLSSSGRSCYLTPTCVFAPNSLLWKLTGQQQDHFPLGIISTTEMLNPVVCMFQIFRSLITVRNPWSGYRPIYWPGKHPLTSSNVRVDGFVACSEVCPLVVFPLTWNFDRAVSWGLASQSACGLSGRMSVGEFTETLLWSRFCQTGRRIEWIAFDGVISILCLIRGLRSRARYATDDLSSGIVFWLCIPLIWTLINSQTFSRAWGCWKNFLVTQETGFSKVLSNLAVPLVKIWKGIASCTVSYWAYR